MMILEYSEHPDYQFPYWLDYHVILSQDNLWEIMDVNAWTGQTFGNLGVVWGYLKTRDDIPTGGAKYNLKHQPVVHHSWRFKNKDDAMLFRLTWHNK